MAMLNDDVKKQVKEQFSGLKEPVELVVFTQKMECQFCADTHSLAEELGEVSELISTVVYDFEDNKKEADELGVDKIPAIVVRGKEEDYGIRFYGIPGGYEFTSLIEAIKLVSTGSHELSEETTKFLDGLEKEVHLQVFVTPTCPYCPTAVILGHRMAYYSEKVRSDMVEASEFPHLGTKYQVQGVPRTIINETEHQEGAAPEDMLVEKIKSVL